MNSSGTIRFFPALLAVLLNVYPAEADITFTQGHYYTSTFFERDITEYDSSGAVLGSITLSAAVADEVRGLAFGTDNLLYATVVRDSGFAVLALDGSGTVHATYPLDPAYIGGNISYGKIALDSQYIYVAGPNQLTRFELGNPASGMSIYTNNQIFDVEPLPGGNLLVGSAYEVNEITSAGLFVRSIPLMGGESYTDIRGIEYDPLTNNLFVTHLGHTDFFFRLMRVDATTGNLEENVVFNYADDLFLTSSGDLLVGSRTQTPRLYNQELDLLGMLGNGEQIFITQFTIPEPGTVSYLLMAAIALALHRMRGEARRKSAAATGNQYSRSSR